jgi:hypothetical protein
MKKATSVPNRMHLSRRTAAKGTLLLGACVVIQASLLPGVAGAFDLSQRSGNLNIQGLAEALRATQKTACLIMADQLDALEMTASGFDLHLRSAGLVQQDALKIATAISRLSGTNGPSMRSFSVSYNREIGDIGASALVQSLPASVTEIGMVGCDLGDDSGEVLLDWAGQPSALRMICVENNLYSTKMRNQISDLRHSRPSLFVAV